MRIILVICSILFAFTTYCQEIIVTPLTDGFCQPGVVNKSPSRGVLLEYFIQPNLKLKSNISTAESSKVGYNDRLRFKFKIPLLNREKLKFLLGVDHEREEYEFSFFDNETRYLFESIDDKSLKTTRLSAYALKAINSNMYITARLEGTFNGEYEKFVNFDERYAIYRGALLFGYKKLEGTEYGLGVMYSNGFRKNAVYPILLYNKTFNRHWGVETVIPVLMQLRYNITNKNMLLFGTEYKTRVYSIDVPDEAQDNTDIFNMKRAEVQAGLTYVQQIKGWLWFDVKGGYLYNFTTHFDLASPGKAPVSDFITANPSSGPFVRFGLFLSPPKDYYCK